MSAKCTKNILVVIDLQEDFSRSAKVVEDFACRQIQLAKKRGDRIFLVNYQGSGPTIQSVEKNLRGYPFLHFIYKRTDSGATSILKEIKAKKLSPSKIRVCGVNYDACVYETVAGLYYLLKKQEILIFGHGIANHSSPSTPQAKKKCYRDILKDGPNVKMVWSK